MFTKLRNRFLIVNLVIISIIMFVAFAAIYTITYRDVQNDIRMELGKVMDSYHKKGGLEDQHPVGSIDPFVPVNGGKTVPPPARAVSFMLRADSNWTLTGIESRFEMDGAFYEAALRETSAAGKDSGQFELDGSEWAYTVQQTYDGYMAVYLDVSDRQAILTNLIYTFAAVGLAMLIVIYFTSRYFANRSIAPIKEAFEKQKQFIADASHELKTPLTIINTNADVLLAGGEDTIQNQAKWLHYIKSETERMSKLTGDLLFLTQLDDSQTDMLFANFDMSEAVENILLTMEAVVFEKRIALDYTIEPGLTVYGSGEQMKQVVMILLDNAVKYTKPEGKIALSLKKLSHETVLSVTNTGEGIAPEHLNRIFDRFYRTDASRARKQGGYGLGLAIAKSIVERHKGRISAKSVPGETTTFTVYLP
ncbi:sensor histidine kinase [Paenibacillus thailandensis]|uniref:histidine kinase n=1 Tax=Paenibacillus thailandensis TaxID=393250 RepID=A0ABW5R650_9BACL